jgi:hypothetical protein
LVPWQLQLLPLHVHCLSRRHGPGRRPLADEPGGGTGRVLIPTGYAVNAAYYTATGLPWYAVRAYYFGGPWSGPYYSYSGWTDYAGKNGIACTPGTAIKGGDGIMYNCQ